MKARGAISPLCPWHQPNIIQTFLSNQCRKFLRGQGALMYNILIVEDEVKIAETVMEYLKRDGT